MAEGGVSGVSLEEQLSKFPAQLLDVACADAHLVQLTECFSEWQTRLSTSLQLTAVEVEDIESNWPRNAARQRLEMFRKWQRKDKERATYRSVKRDNSSDSIILLAHIHCIVQTRLHETRMSNTLVCAVC